jgi:hypothetical protein
VVVGAASLRVEVDSFHFRSDLRLHLSMETHGENMRR